MVLLRRLQLLPFVSFAASLILYVASTTPKAHGEVVLSNLSNASSYSGLGQFTRTRAVSFQTNGFDWNLTNFSFAAYANSAGQSADFTIRLYSAASNSPFDPIGSAVISTTISIVSLPSDGVDSATPISINTSNWSLAANTNYAIEVESSNSLAFWAKRGNTFDTSTWTPLGNFANNFGTWNTDNAGSNLAFRLEATAVPEPSTIVTFSLCIIGVLIWRFIGIAR